MWATMRWSGRTAWPSMCQPRCSTSIVRASIHLPLQRLADLDGLGDRWRVGHEEPAGLQHRFGLRDHLPRLGQVEHHPVEHAECRVDALVAVGDVDVVAVERRLAEEALRRSCVPGWRSLRGSRSRRCRRRSAASSSTAPPTRSRSRTPARPARCRRACRSGRDPSGRSPARRAASRRRSPRASDAARCTPSPSSSARRRPRAGRSTSAWATKPLWLWNSPPSASVDQVAPLLGVEQQRLLPRCEHSGHRRRPFASTISTGTGSCACGLLDQPAERTDLARRRRSAPHALVQRRPPQQRSARPAAAPSARGSRGRTPPSRPATSPRCAFSDSLYDEVPVAGRDRALLDDVVDAAHEAPRRHLALGQADQRLDLLREPVASPAARAAGGRGSRCPSAACCRTAPPPRRRGCGR